MISEIGNKCRVGQPFSDTFRASHHLWGSVREEHVQTNGLVRQLVGWGRALTAILVWTGACAAQDSSFEPKPSAATGLNGLASVEIVDLDGDGDMDFLAATGSTGQILWVESDGNVNPQFPLTHIITNFNRHTRCCEMFKAIHNLCGIVLSRAPAQIAASSCGRLKGSTGPLATDVRRHSIPAQASVWLASRSAT